MRLLLGDAWSGGLLAVVTAACVFFHMAASSYACSVSLSAPHTVSVVICHGSGFENVEVPAPGPEKPQSAHGCPCGALCAMGGGSALPVAEIDLGAAYSLAGAIDLDFSSGDDSCRDACANEAPPFPTGPPALSV
ncbi:hypothetical protein [Fulvimarina endophytica]|nr:hypothetical protein [Fulvimarina endophytica]